MIFPCGLSIKENTKYTRVQKTNKNATRYMEVKDMHLYAEKEGKNEKEGKTE